MTEALYCTPCTEGHEAEQCHFNRRFFVMGFWEQIPKLSPYFINFLLFCLFNTTLKSMMTKSFQMREIAWDCAHSQGNIWPFLLLQMIDLFSSPEGGRQCIFKETPCSFPLCCCSSQVRDFVSTVIRVDI